VRLEAHAIDEAGQIAGAGGMNGATPAFLTTQFATLSDTTPVAMPLLPLSATFAALGVLLGVSGFTLRRR
jgi:hypothetical protein